MIKNKGKTKTIKVDYLARVEGEGALYVKYDDKGVQDVKLKIFEPPRFFEAFLRGRDYSEAPDITSRICGICPVAYQMSAVHAMENAFGMQLPESLRALRRLLYCGEWIESHVLHIFMLHAPDFLGYHNAVEMAKDHQELVTQGLQLKKAGNDIVNILGGREIHPINVRVGGFYRLPEKQELEKLAESLKLARDLAIATVRWTATLNFPDFERDYEFVALSHPDEYPFNEGRLVSNRGLDIDASGYDDCFEEMHIEYTHALQSVIKGRGAFLAGPMARYNLNYDRLASVARELATEIDAPRYCSNPFQSIIIRSLEVLHAADEALSLIENYEKPEQPFVPAEPRAATGYAITEAPRGLLYHRYTIDRKGKISDAKIVSPTSQNQLTIEEDLESMIPAFLDLPEEALRAQCEQAIRNYDPCISCATHFLQLHLDKH